VPLAKKLKAEQALKQELSGLTELRVDNG